MLKSLIARTQAKTPLEFSGVGTLFMSDVSLVEMSAPIDSDTLAATTNAGFNSVNRCIQKMGGIIIRSTGDATVAVWGPSHTSPCHADLAVRCALEILRARNTTSQSNFSALMSICLATGKMTIASIGGRLQVYGPPVAAVERLVRMENRFLRSHVLYTSDTADYLTERLQPNHIGEITGSCGAPVAVYEFTA